LRHQTHDTLTDDSDKAITLLATSQAIVEALNNNLNTPEALRIVDQAFSKFDGKSLGDIHQHGLVRVLETIDEILGLQLIGTTPDIDDETKQLIIKRQRARDDKKWKESDQIRDQIAAMGIVVKDTNGGTIWEYADDAA
jgi:cysteinyl-tRNA synthetase